MAKATNAAQARRLEDIPNIGPASAGDLRRLGIEYPRQLVGQDPQDLYKRLCQLSGRRLDPCVLDVLMAAVDFMAGGPPRPWWEFTPTRKRLARRGA